MIERVPPLSPTSMSHCRRHRRLHRHHHTAVATAATFATVTTAVVTAVRTAVSTVVANAAVTTNESDASDRGSRGDLLRVLRSDANSHASTHVVAWGMPTRLLSRVYGALSLEWDAVSDVSNAREQTTHVAHAVARIEWSMRGHRVMRGAHGELVTPTHSVGNVLARREV